MYIDNFIMYFYKNLPDIFINGVIYMMMAYCYFNVYQIKANFTTFLFYFSFKLYLQSVSFFDPNTRKDIGIIINNSLNRPFLLKRIIQL